MVVVCSALFTAFVSFGLVRAWGASSDGQSKLTPIVFTATTSHGSASPEQDPKTVIQETRANLGGAAVVDAHVAAPPKGQSGESWFYAQVAVPSLARGLDIKEVWEADLLQGALAENLGESYNLRGSLAGSSFDAVLPDGEVVKDITGGQGDIVRGQVFSAESDSQKLTDQIKATVKDFGLEPHEIECRKAPSLAPYVIATASDDMKAAKDYYSLVSALFGERPEYPGYYIELSDEKGDAFIRASAEFRTGAGRVWLRPGWAGKNLIGIEVPGQS
jgi:hypothetical protein